MLKVNLHYIDKNSQTAEATFISICDEVQGEIGIYNNHITIHGKGQLLKYNTEIINDEFIYNVENNIIDIYFM